MPTNGSRRDHAYRTLKARIVDVDLAPGHRLVERDLAAELDVSRIPLREALRMLAVEGLVVTVAGQGTVVSPVTPDDVRDLFDVRESLEPLAARLAAERADAAGLRRLRDCLATARDHLDDPRRLTGANADFHAAMIAAAGNRLLTGILADLDARVRRLFHLTIGRDLTGQHHEHEELYRAIRDGDAARAARLAAEHVGSGREATVAAARRWSTTELDPVSLTRTRRRPR